jgi:hypothetical protein
MARRSRSPAAPSRERAFREFLLGSLERDVDPASRDPRVTRLVKSPAPAAASVPRTRAETRALASTAARHATAQRVQQPAADPRPPAEAEVEEAEPPAAEEDEGEDPPVRRSELLDRLASLEATIRELATANRSGKATASRPKPSAAWLSTDDVQALEDLHLDDNSDDLDPFARRDFDSLTPTPAIEETLRKLDPRAARDMDLLTTGTAVLALRKQDIALAQRILTRRFYGLALQRANRLTESAVVTLMQGVIPPGQRLSPAYCNWALARSRNVF